MPDLTSPLAGASFETTGIALREAPDFELFQYAGTEANLRRECGGLPEFGTAEGPKKHTLFRIGKGQLLALGDEIDTRLCSKVDLTSGRCRIALSGDKARDLLSACAAVDFSEAAFGKMQYALTGIHHIPVMIHALRDGAFHLYAPRSYANSLWEWLVDAALGLG